ncbi:MAG: helix-hairpin-helix domain-containing protein [Bacteroidota bacterium]
MKTFLENYFHFSRSERNGFLVLVIILVALFIIPSFLPTNKEEPPADFSEFQAALDQYFHQRQLAQTKKKTFQKRMNENKPVQLQAFPFNPNTLSTDSLLLMGLAPKVVQTWQRYREKGGRFRRKSDVSKIYGLNENTFAQLAPYIQFTQPSRQADKEKQVLAESPILLFAFDPNQISYDSLLLLGLSKRVAQTMVNFRNKGGRFRQKEELSKLFGLRRSDYERLLPYVSLDSIVTNSKATSPKSAKTEAKSPSLRIDINRASESQWQELKGIGPFYAQKIVRFREKLGGFHQINQIAETYGLPDSTFQKIRPKLVLSPLLRHIAINSASLDQLKAHPYIKWKQAQIIVNYRQQHGPYSKAADLLEIKVLDEPWLQKIEPYLIFD